MSQRARDKLTRPIIGIEHRTPQEVFDIMVDRFTRADDTDQLRLARRIQAEANARVAIAIIAPAVLDMAILETSSLCAEETCGCCCDILSDAADAILALKAQFEGDKV